MCTECDAKEVLHEVEICTSLCRQQYITATRTWLRIQKSPCSWFIEQKLCKLWRFQSMKWLANTFPVILLSVSFPPFRLRYDQHCVGWGVKLYSLTQRTHHGRVPGTRALSPPVGNPWWVSVAWLAELDRDLTAFPDFHDAACRCLRGSTWRVLP